MFDRVKQQCEQNNQRMRCIGLHGSLSADRVLCAAGDLLITGGQRARRRELVLRTVCRTREQFPDQAVLLLTDSRDTEHALISLVEAGALDALIVTSPEHPNYRPFRSWRPDEVVSCLLRTVRFGHCDTAELCEYASAFLEILDRLEPSLSLQAMTEFAQNSDTAIASWGQRNRMERQARRLADSIVGGKNFRELLQTFSTAFFSVLAAGDTAGFDLADSARASCVILFRVDTIDLELVADYFAWILCALAGKGNLFSVVLDEPLLLRQPAFLRAMEALTGKVPFTVSAEDAVGIQSEDFWGRFKRGIILLDGKTAGLQDALNSLGEYTHFEPARSVSAPPRLFWSPVRSTGRNVLTYQRSKLLLEELAGFQAVLYGDRGPQISLVRRLER